MSQARHVFGRYEANMRSHATNRPEQEAEKSLEGEDNKARQDLEADVYKVASTGAQVTLASAKPLLYTFCGKLAYDKYVGRPVLLSLVLTAGMPFGTPIFMAAMMS